MKYRKVWSILLCCFSQAVALRLKVEQLLTSFPETKKKTIYFFFALALCSVAYSQTATDSLFYPYQKGNVLRYYYPHTNYKYITQSIIKDTLFGKVVFTRTILKGVVDPKKHIMDSLSMYHPLHKMNVWIYKRNSHPSPSYYDNMFISREIVGDTLFENKQYQKILEKNSKDGSSKLTVERFDSSNGNFYQGFPHTAPGMNVEFSLADSTAADILNTSFRSGKLIKLSPDTVFHQQSLTRSIVTLLTIDVTIVKRYSYGFGMVREEHSVMESYYDSLVYARINGKEYGSKPLSVDMYHNVIPSSYSLSQNFPNPFNPVTTISYQIPVEGMVSLKVYSILGREIATLVHQQQKTGSYSLFFNGSSLASGVYFYRFHAGNYHNIRKMILTK
ncbi:MAG: T9SS type A sorting domain-containing protein [Bacteroidota bacterium]